VSQAGCISPRGCEILKFVLKVAQSGIMQISKHQLLNLNEKLTNLCSRKFCKIELKVAELKSAAILARGWIYGFVFLEDLLILKLLTHF
jgi:hypothetical protein